MGEIGTLLTLLAFVVAISLRTWWARQKARHDADEKLRRRRHQILEEALGGAYDDAEDPAEKLPTDPEDILKILSDDVERITVLQDEMKRLANESRQHPSPSWEAYQALPAEERARRLADAENAAKELWPDLGDQEEENGALDNG